MEERILRAIHRKGLQSALKVCGRWTAGKRRAGIQDVGAKGIRETPIPWHGMCGKKEKRCCSVKLKRIFRLMKTTELNERKNKEWNEDPITHEPGSHPLATGLGAAGAGAAGAAIGAGLGGPVGMAIGGAVGAIVGGLSGKATGEVLHPTSEEAFWREHHSTQPYAREHPYETFEPAYRSGYQGYTTHGKDRTFDASEEDVRRLYESNGTGLPWDSAREASREAWERAAVWERAGSMPPILP